MMPDRLLNRDMSWGANAVYADDFGSSVSVLDNTFYLGARVPTVFESNQGRDHQMIGNKIFPLPPHTSDANSPRANIGNCGCGGGGTGPYPCTACMLHGAALQAAFLNRVPFNSSSAWKAAFPSLYDFWETKPCEAGGIQIRDNIVCFAGLLAGTISASGSVVTNNSWIPEICGGPAPPPAPPPPPPVPADPALQVAAHSGSCASMTSSPMLLYNKTDGAIYVENGPQAGKLLAVFWGNAGADHSPVLVSAVDVPEFKQYKNVIFDLSEDGADVTIKLRVNGKCITGPSKLPGPVLLDPCVAGSQQRQWSFDVEGTSTKKTFALRSKVGGCATIGSSRSTTGTV